MFCRPQPGKRERFVLALLLAFLICTVRAPFQPRAHHHAGGDRPHVHVGTILFAPVTGMTRAFRDIPPPAQRTSERGIAQTPAAAALHQHLTRPLHHAWARVLVVGAPATWTAPLVPSSPVAPPAVTAIAGQARAPPLLPA